MRRELGLIPAGLLALLAPAGAQTHGGQNHGSHNHHAGPYADLQTRSIKALSDEEIADLRAGRGMGLALPAELNGYPGPLHVLELADALALTPDQRARTGALIDAMRTETIPLGERIVAAEAALDRAFAESRITAEDLAAMTSRIGALRGELRAAHLRYHLAMRSLLTPEQIARYETRRGYR